MRIEIGGRSRRWHPSDRSSWSDNGGGIFFAEVLHLSSGRFKARVHIIFSEFAARETVTITVRDVSTGKRLAETSLPADLQFRPAGDEIYLSFTVLSAGHVEFSGHVSRHRDSTLLRLLTVLDDPDNQLSRSDFFFSDTAPASLADLQEISIGTTGVCNASCLHCPTNKKTFPMPHGRMSDQLFKKIFVGLKEGGYRGKIFFGLFAEPLEDPMLIERTKFIKDLLPNCEVFIATNGALFDPAKHEQLFDYVNFIGVHVEAMDATIYNELMHPLKADRVMPKVIAMLDMARQKGHRGMSITTPIHKGNIGQVRAISAFCRENEVPSSFTSFCSRAWEGGIYPKLAIAPAGGMCRPNVMVTSMFIDFDGLVLPCCFDFSRSLPLGNLNHQSFQEVFDGPEWRSLYGVFKRGEWSTRGACARCRADDANTILGVAASLSASIDSDYMSLSPSSFSATSIVKRNGNGGLQVELGVEDGIAIYGPYVTLSPGAYRAYHQLTITQIAGDCAIELDACVNYGTRIAERKIDYKGDAQIEASIDFEIKSREPVELRVFKHGSIGFEHRGVKLIKL